MADIAISYVMQKLTDLLNEAVFLRGVTGQVNCLQNELQWMQCFLKDANAKQGNDERVRDWIAEIRDVAYDVEDIIDTFIIRVESRKRSFFARYACVINENLSLLNEVGKEIEAIHDRIHKISRSRETLGIRICGEDTSPSTNGSPQTQRSTPCGVEKDIVGLKEDTDKLVAQLVNKEDRLSVVSIIGTGGIGKTTLAKKVYNHVEIRDHFDCRAWTYVSRKYSIRDLWQGIIKQVKTPTKELVEKMGKSQDHQLKEMLYEFLKEKCYLVVLDDICTTEAWDFLAKAFPDTRNGSRLMLTTRNKDVALHDDIQNIPYELQLLENEESWELFCRKTFGMSSPTEFENIGRKIVERCSGLPLAIIIMGGLLSRKNKLLSEWEMVYNNMGSHFANDPIGVSTILTLSYNELPHYLKFCFLYLGHFPENYTIGTRKLFHLWVAEGLIPQQGETMVTAEQYLDELIKRNMVQAVRMSSNERVKECKIHDLLRDLSISRAKEEIFLDIHEDEDHLPSAKTRHQAVHANRYFSRPTTPHLRSLLFFNPSKYKIFTQLGLICKNFKLLRVLDLKDLWISYLPGEIGSLLYLRYLGLGGTVIKYLPLSMRNLQNLQTLDISNLYFDKLPNVIGKMENLQHLYMEPLDCIGQLKIDTLIHLQTLSLVRVQNWKGNNSEKLISLQKLKVNIKFEPDAEFFDSIAKLPNLLSLELTHVGQPPTFKSLNKLCNLQRLTKLYIWAHLPELPRLQEFPPNLNHLILCASHLKQEQVHVLEKLPKLLILKLTRWSYDGKELVFSANGFHQLKFLELNVLANLQELKVEEGAMPSLSHFRISKCLNLISLPEEMKFFSVLQELEIDGMPQNFESKLRGEDSYKIQRVSSVNFTNIKK
ncbi:disease resistance RPP8-like protein 3 [Malania oleifera]|uniref:disease resistance RPP8-like protein 3 n=1 Tax=Malania oleifera TaxID=397392 RepID=UPI0025ADB43F|nr:disease resistance RPP8-like protein 3 [Malania oleifera]